MKRHRRAGTDEAGVDMTPLLDIVFIMLIFFIVTATFIRERGIDIVRPDDSELQTQANVPPIVLRVTATNEVWLKGREIDPRAVRANVARERAATPDAPVLVLANPDANVQTSLTVMDQARAAGANAVVLEANEQN